MNRRTFLGVSGLSLATALVNPWEAIQDPERALWVPKAKTIFIPKVVAVRKGLPTPTLGAAARYTVTIGSDCFGESKVLRFDDDWVPVGGYNSAEGREFSADELATLQEEWRLKPRRNPAFPWFQRQSLRPLRWKDTERFQIQTVGCEPTAGLGDCVSKPSEFTLVNGFPYTKGHQG